MVEGRHQISLLCKLLLLLCCLSYAGTVISEAYLLIDAIAKPESSKQPTWIGVRKGARMLHFPTQQSIISVEPGTYRLHHIDFHKSKVTSMGTLQSTLPNEVVIKARDDSITYVGLIQVEGSTSRLDKRAHNVNILTTKLLFEWACDKNPEVFTRLPVKFLGKENENKKIKVNCES